MRRLLITLAMGLLTVSAAQAQIGWTLAECEQHFGKEAKLSSDDPSYPGGNDTHSFKANVHSLRVSVLATIPEGSTVESVSYQSNRFLPETWASQVISENAKNYRIGHYRTVKGADDFHGKQYYFLDIFPE
jgi:hypothetical protein